MKKYVCSVCGYIYDEVAGDPDNGIAAGTKWEDVPEDFVCPLCGVGKDQFEEALFLAEQNACAFCSAQAFFLKQREKGKIAGTVRLCYNDRDFSTES